MTPEPAVKHALEMDAKHRYRCTCGSQTCEGVVFQSVTTILGKAVPKNLAWYGQTRGVAGVKGLMRLRRYDVRRMKPQEVRDACAAEGVRDSTALQAVPRYDIASMSPEAITEALKRERLTVNDHRDQRAEEGTALHVALDDYGTKQTIPVASTFPEHERGRVRGLAKFITTYRPEFVATEVQVLSTEHWFAGTFDVLAYIYARLVGGNLVPDPESRLFALIDLKTSKWVYPASHFPQLEAYEGARVENGEPATDVRAVLWVTADGGMELVPSTASFADFVTLKQSAETLQRLGSIRRPRRK